MSATSGSSWRRDDEATACVAGGVGYAVRPANFRGSGSSGIANGVAAPDADRLEGDDKLEGVARLEGEVGWDAVCA